MVPLILAPGRLSMNSEKTILFEIENGIALITLNRPEKKNSLNQSALRELFNHIDEVASNDDIRVAIITGSGDSFCAGLDLGAVGKEELIDEGGDTSLAEGLAMERKGFDGWYKKVRGQ